MMLQEAGAYSHRCRQGWRNNARRADPRASSPPQALGLPFAPVAGRRTATVVAIVGQSCLLRPWSSTVAAASLSKPRRSRSGASLRPVPWRGEAVQPDSHTAKQRLPRAFLPPSLLVHVAVAV